jgi:hypothetical protein
MAIGRTRGIPRQTRGGVPNCGAWKGRLTRRSLVCRLVIAIRKGEKNGK